MNTLFSHVPSFLRALILLLVLTVTSTAPAADLKLLFMGDNGHHRPSDRFHELAPILEARGIELKYTDRMDDLTAETLAGFDGLVLYANIDKIEDAQAKAVLDYVADGKGFIPLHCATFCWRNNAEIVKLMGGQFQRHGGQVFGVVNAEPAHPIMKGFGGFTSWDETYIHTLHNEENRTVLEYRVEGDQAPGNTKEPWTWIRTHGKGRVFYTAWGHDSRTWTNPGFPNLVERGIRWACGKDVSVVPAFQNTESFTPPKMTELTKDVKPFEYVDVGPKIPNYTPGRQWGVQGAPKSTMQLPLSVEESMKHYSMPEGMVLRRYADERNFQAKPIAMNWDERGRLWICETLDYPNELGQNRDRIRICEDTDGDHVADKFTIFAEGLSIPTAIMIFRGGAVVHNATETIYLKDTNGDDKADQTTVLMTGFGAGDTHGGISNFRYGLDNWIWAMQGYNDSAPEFDGKKSDSFRQGFWRFRLSNTDPPKVTDVEFIRSTNNNTWGLGLSEEGLVFGSTANHNPSTFVPIANRYYEKVRGWAAPDIGTIADTWKFSPITENVRQVDQFGGYTAGAGHALYTARTFPMQWWNKTAFVCEPTGHLIGTFLLRRDGATYKSTSPTNLLASDDEWASPIMAEVGPDGAVWVIDWYNFIIQHNPTPQGFKTGKGNAYESDLRDKKHGRIYRVLPNAEGQDVMHPWKSLANASVSELVETLSHPSMNWRLQAQRLLVERQATDAAPQLLAMIEDPSVDEIGLNVGVMHALQTLKGLGVDDLKAVASALGHVSPGVRRHAIAVLPHNEAGLKTLLSSPAVFTDADAQVRLQSFVTLSDMPVSSDAASVIFSAAAKAPDDPVMVDALTIAASVHCTQNLSRFSAVAGHETPASSLQIAGRVAEHVGRSRPDAVTLEGLLTDLSMAQPAVTDAALQGLIEGLPAGFSPEVTDGLDKALVKLLEATSGQQRGKVVRVASICGSKSLESYTREIVDSLLKLVADENAATNDRVSSAKEAVSFQPGNTQVLESVLNVINLQTIPDVGIGLIEAAGQSTAETAGELIISRMDQMTPQMKSAAMRVLLSRPATTSALLAAVQAGRLEIGDLSLDQKQALRVHPDKDIRALAETLMAAGGGLPDADRDKVLKSLLPICDEEGDAKAGKAMFLKHCSKCHMHGTEGKAIGPNLTGMAVHPRHELLTHIIDPSRSVEGNFRIYTVVRTDGIVINGMMSGESRTAITLIDTEGKENQIAREDIDELVRSRKSLMPEGFEKQMTTEELSNLLAFLTDKGKFIPVSLDRYATAISTKGLFSDGDDGPDRMVFGDWTPKIFQDVPFILTDPRGKTVRNIILLYGPNSPLPASMPKSVTLPCNSEAKAIHILGGVGGWNFPYDDAKTVSMIVRLHYKGGATEDIELINGVHMADYIRKVDVPKSDFAFMLGGQQVRRVLIHPKKTDVVIDTIELVKGPDRSAPIIMAVTVERP
ncbi:MAG: PVC-type heme-binding CxxCH protein [Planctomycetota bacterium]